MKDLEDLHFFLRIEVKRTSDSFHLSQQKYIKERLEKGALDSYELAKTLMYFMFVLLNFEDDPLLNPTPYRSIVSAFHYCVLIRFEISFQVSK